MESKLSLRIIGLQLATLFNVYAGTHCESTSQSKHSAFPPSPPFPSLPLPYLRQPPQASSGPLLATNTLGRCCPLEQDSVSRASISQPLLTPGSHQKGLSGSCSLATLRSIDLGNRLHRLRRGLMFGWADTEVPRTSESL